MICLLRENQLVHTLNHKSQLARRQVPLDLNQLHVPLQRRLPEVAGLNSRREASEEVVSELLEHSVDLKRSPRRRAVGGSWDVVEFSSGLDELSEDFEDGTSLGEVLGLAVELEELREGLGVGEGTDGGWKEQRRRRVSDLSSSKEEINMTT